MPITKARKSRIAILLVRERKDGTVRQNRIRNLFLILAAAGVVAVLVFLGVRLSRANAAAAQDRLLVYENSVNALNETVEELTKENEDLNSKVYVLTETVARQAAQDELNEAKAWEDSLPKGFPLGGFGASNMNPDPEDELTLVILSVEGNTIITVGTGIVESIEADETYGTRLVVDHQNGYKSVYLNQGRPLVRIGDELGKRSILFIMGADNRSLGFQIYEGDEKLDPLSVMEIAG